MGPWVEGSKAYENVTAGNGSVGTFDVTCSEGVTVGSVTIVNSTRVNDGSGAHSPRLEGVT